MQAPRAPRPFLIAALAVVFILYIIFLYSTVMLMISMRGPGHDVMSMTTQLPQPEFAIFWYSGKLLMMNFINAHGGAAVITPAMQHTFEYNLFARARPFALTWLYPPTMGLLAALFSLLPIALSFWVWRGLFFIIAAALLRRAGLDWPSIIMGLISTAELRDATGGENGLLTGGLTVSSLLLFDRAPGAAGGIAGLLCIKPQLGALLPFILLRKIRRRALAACALSVFILVVASVLFEGWQSWFWFFGHAPGSSAGLVGAKFAMGTSTPGATVLFMARSFGIAAPLAWGLQGLSSLTAAVLVWRLWQRPDADGVARMALTTCLWVFVTPYGYVYDLVGFSVGMAAMFFRAPDRFKPLFGLFWLTGGYSITVAVATGRVLTPVAVALAGGTVWWLMNQPNAALRSAV